MDGIHKFLLDFGIPVNLTGFDYLHDAVNMVIEDKAVIRQMVKTIYPGVASLHGSTSQRTERAMRHAIEVGFSRAEPELIKSVFGGSVNYNSGKATNSEFIAAVALRLRGEEE